MLAETADQDLLVEQRGLQAELAQIKNALVAAQAKLELIQRQLERAHVRAPFDGVIIKGDLSQSVGAPAGAGCRAPYPGTARRPPGGDRSRREQVAELKLGQIARLILAAIPAQTMPIQLDRITSLASTEDIRRYFAVYAALDGKLPALRPGMQGVAGIEVDRRPHAGELDHAQLPNWLRLKLWSWGT